MIGNERHIDDEILVAEAGAAFGENNFLIAGRGDFFGSVADVPGREELAFFEIDDAAGFAGGFEQIGLAAEEGRDLKDVADFGGARDLRDVMNIGEHGDADGFF